MNLPIIGFIEMWMVILAVVIFFWATSALKHNRRAGKYGNPPAGVSVCPRPGCGCENPDRARFCRNCGIALSSERSRGGESSTSGRWS